MGPGLLRAASATSHFVGTFDADRNRDLAAPASPLADRFGATPKSRRDSRRHERPRADDNIGISRETPVGARAGRRSDFGGTLPATRVALELFGPWFITTGRRWLLRSRQWCCRVSRGVSEGRHCSASCGRSALVFGFPVTSSRALQTVPAAHGGVVSEISRGHQRFRRARSAASGRRCVLVCGLPVQPSSSSSPCVTAAATVLGDVWRSPGLAAQALATSFRDGWRAGRRGGR